MKLKFLFLVILIVSCKSKKPETSFVSIDASKVETIKKDRALDLGTRLLSACNTSKFKRFSDAEATEKVIKNATLKNISTVCRKINFRNGKFLGLKLISILQNTSTNQYTFLYAIDYEKKFYKRQLIVVVDQDNRVSSMVTKEVKRKPL